MPHLHVALVTGRPEANLIPLLQLTPEHVCLVASQRMVGAADRLHALLKQQLPAHTEIRVHPGLPNTDPQAISQYAFELAEALDARKSELDDLTITYDMTGGTKLMALLFQEAMRCCGAEMLYVDSDAGTLYHMGGDLRPDSFRNEPIRPVLNADLYLLANGKQRGKTLSDDANWRANADARKALTKHLGLQAEKLDSLMGYLNYLIHVTQPGKEAVLLPGDRQSGPQLNEAGWQQRLTQVPRGDWKAALQAMADAGMLQWSAEEPQELLFSSREGALYLGGGWLEEYAWHSARDAGLDDVHCGAHVTDLTGRRHDVRNEFDCLAVHRNRMLIIECKTAKLNVDERDQQVLHKLHSLADQSAGLYGTQVLLTSREFGTARHRDTNLKRAQGMRVNVTEGAQLKQLPAHIRGWMETGRWPH